MCVVLSTALDTTNVSGELDMIWMLAASAALSALQTTQANKEKVAQAKAQNKVNYAADLQTATNTAANIGSLLVQQGQLRVSAAKQFNEAEREAYKATGTAQAQAAAAQVKGASVDAVLGDIDRELGEAQASTEQNFEVGNYNLTNSIREMTSGAISSLRGGVNPYAGQQSALVNGLMSAGQTYMSQAFRFGSTSK
ncbi:putative internal virion protein [Pseudomonas phage MR6]|uniref:Putative internal virion protein n=1 Tax=Pseudomonas phage MR5 TaxID=2711172 RepID=A0A6M3TCR0_9CAUD|nr:putative internal virion protein [Pseudomonas phage MR5]QJD54872.1 putative internal virion protein [Pseudomonas phage MR6]QJD54932.1 putative internal virion protein [Pseudomonas phage MR7]QJD54990.1 putative tail tubular protein [Pseudomonas phage MR8]QJD55047.1 putative tail tubular protein [Pseudomonas phage MR12]QJF74614.1 putative internal virion protein [Pseudomonas phage MR16]